jgi:GTP-binding protein
MLADVDREKRIQDIVKRLKYKGPVFEISALTREGCELLVQKVYAHIAKVHTDSLPPVDVDPRFVDAPEAP